jgi:hypothetical protein
MRPGDIAAHADFACQCIVPGRTVDQNAEARVGKTCAPVFHHRMHYVAVTAFHQDIGYGFAE